MIAKLLNLLQAAAPDYLATYEEAKMMNVKADGIAYDKGFIYIEEYLNGNYTEKYGITKTTRVDIYFCRFTEMHADALEREAIRSQIEAEAVAPFLKAYRSSDFIKQSPMSVSFAHPVPRFDANEVSIRLTLSITEELCQ